MRDKRVLVILICMGFFIQFANAVEVEGSIYGSGSSAVGKATSAVGQIGKATGQLGNAVGGIAAPINNAVSGVTNQINSAVSGVTAPINNAIGGITGSLGGITSAFSSITGFASSIQSVLGQISSITGMFSSIFDSFNLNSIFDQVSGNNNLLSCVAGGLGFDTGSLMKKFGFNIKGICSLAGLGSGGSGFNLGNIAKCIGVGGSGGLGKSLSSLCSSAVASGVSGGGSIGGSIGGGDYLGGGDTGAGGGGTGGGGMSGGGSEYSADNIAIIESSISDQFKINNGEGEPVKPEDIEFRGITGKELWKTGGGYINKKTRGKPGSSTAQANLDFDIPALVLKEKALQMTGSDKVNKIQLPATKADVLEKENKVAQTAVDGMVDLHLEGDSLAMRAREKFLKLKSKSLSDYYSKEAKAYKDLRKNDKRLNALYDVAKQTVGLVYSQRMFALTRDSNYVFDPSMSRASMIDPKYRTTYIFASLHEMEKETALKTAAALEMKKQRILLDIMAQRAYVSASIFRSDIAKKEIDDMLKAIDQTIK